MGVRQVLAEDRAMTQLARRLASDGMIAPDAFAASLEAVLRFVQQANALGCRVVRAFATSAVRDASNGTAFSKAVHDATFRVGVPITLELVSEREEGLLALRSAESVASISAQRVAVADLGGGSLEVVLADHGTVTFNRSLPLGAVRLTDQFGGPEAISGPRFEDLISHVHDVLHAALPATPAVPNPFIASGGTLTTLAAIANASSYPDALPPPQRWTVSASDVAEILERVRTTPIADRIQIAGLAKDRVEIILPGLVVVRELLNVLQAPSVQVNPLGLREGLLIKVIDEARAAHCRS